MGECNTILSAYTLLHSHIDFIVRIIFPKFCKVAPFTLLLLCTGYCTFLKVLFNPLPNKPWFLCVCSTSLWKTLWEKEQLLVTSTCSCSHSVFYRLEKFLPNSLNSTLLSANSFSLEETKICRLGKA